MGGTPCPVGLRFGPTTNGKWYLSLHAHRGHRPIKSAWCIEPDEEYEIFVSSDDGNWVSDLGHYWGVRGPDAETLGNAGERICKFPRAQNPQNEWHGYP